MKKYYLIAFFWALCIVGVEAQTSVGLRVSPALSFNRLDSDSQVQNFSANGIGARFAFGPFVDIFMRENYYFSTGLIFTGKRAAFSVWESGVEESETYNLQYLQIPLGIKLFTNEVALDTRIYFHLGGFLEIKIQERAGEPEYDRVERFRAFDVSTYVGTGVEHRIGVNTILFGGFSYTRGLVNVMRRANSENTDNFSLKNDMVSLDLGIKF